MSQPSGSRLRITEIFYSLQGESRSVGWPTVFIRLTGCPLRCGYCDTTYAFTGGTWMEFDEIFLNVKKYRTEFVTVTGGEPLAQSNCISLLSQLCDQQFQVSLETSGALDVSQVDTRVSKVIDIKTPDSGEVSKNRWQNLDHINVHDQIKFVICSRADYDWSVQQVEQRQLNRRCEVLFSPAFSTLLANNLADWILADQLNVRFQLQLHKILWGDQRGR